MFRLQKISKRYHRGSAEIVALRPTSFEVGVGEFIAVVGPSGSGKTTLLSILGGMLAPSDGKLWLDGQSLYDATAGARAAIRQRQIGFVFQTFNLVPYLTALENVKAPLMLAGVPSDKQQEIAAQLLVRVGLTTRFDHKPSELSVGQQQRVALARTLANDPKVILADEPTGNLDPQTREQVLEFLEEFSRDGRTVVMVTHDPAAAARAGRIIQLVEGGVAADEQQSARKAA
ncbi:MAG: ABC transporter ATP-binding protein [Pirellulales bacterium]|nr:ABC transporter ATP-binding protein [Pirellulales bacterium]